MATFIPPLALVDDLDPALLDVQRQVNQMLAAAPRPDLSRPDGLQMLRAQTAPPQATPELRPSDVVIDGPAGPLRLHILAPERPPIAVMLRIHGGGWAAGTPEDDEELNDKIARRLGIVIVSPEYRLVPQASIADQIEDCVAAAQWVAAEAEARFGTDRLLLGGISAGAYLAVSTLLRLRDRGEPAFEQIEGVHLDCGAYDLSGSPTIRRATNETLVLSRDLIDQIITLGLPGVDEEARRDPSISPLYADLTGLPPALFTVGTLDPSQDDSSFLAWAWRLAGNHAELDVWPEGAHAFTNMGTPLGAVALDRTVAWLAAVLDTTALDTAEEQNR